MKQVDKGWVTTVKDLESDWRSCGLLLVFMNVWKSFAIGGNMVTWICEWINDTRGIHCFHVARVYLVEKWISMFPWCKDSEHFQVVTWKHRKPQNILNKNSFINLVHSIHTKSTSTSYSSVHFCGGLMLKMSAFEIFISNFYVKKIAKYHLVKILELLWSSRRLVEIIIW